MEPKEILATVGNREITRQEVNTLLQNINPQTARQFQSEEGIKNLVKELAYQELFYLDAVEKGLDEEDEFQLEMEKAKANILKQYALNKVLSSASVSESETKSYYLENQMQFSAPPSVKASHILVDQLEKAEEIADEIEKGLSFNEAAKHYSKCPSKDKGGDLGYFSTGMMVPEFEKAAFLLEIGELSKPVKTQFGYHLILVSDKKEAANKTYEEVKAQLSNQLLNQKQQKLYQEKLEELKKKYPVALHI